MSATSPAPSVLSPSADAPSNYLRSKAAGEAAMRAAGGSALDLTILRPSVMFGEHDRALRAISQRRRECKRVKLERNRHVETAAAVRAKGPDRRGESIHRRQDRTVLDVFPRLLRESGMDARRQAVRDRISDDGVAVGHGCAIAAERCACDAMRAGALSAP